jgi:hypothetical protein
VASVLTTCLFVASVSDSSIHLVTCHYYIWSGDVGFKALFTGRALVGVTDFDRCSNVACEFRPRPLRRASFTARCSASDACRCVAGATLARSLGTPKLVTYDLSQSFDVMLEPGASTDMKFLPFYLILWCLIGLKIPAFSTIS